MGRCRFVVRKTKRIDISDGDWIDVKEELNIGEVLDVEGAGIEISQKQGDSEPTYKLSRSGDAAVVRVAVWLADWSLCDIAGKKVILSKEAVRRLDSKTFDELLVAIDAHIKDVEGACKKEDGKEEDTENSPN